MHAKCVIAALLIMTTALSASACVEGVVGSAATSRVQCSRALRNQACPVIVKFSPGHCGVRGLLQFHFVSYQSLDSEPRFSLLSQRVFVSPRPGFRISSIGSPETDRGPPLS